jgi:hypothetical protein
MVIEDNDEHPEKQSSPIDEIELGMVIEDNDEHL